MSQWQLTDPYLVQQTFHPSLKVDWDRCYDFKNIFAEIFGENIGVFTQTNASF
jgi:hypothetical protein